MSATHVAVILHMRTGPAYEEESMKMDYPDVRNEYSTLQPSIAQEDYPEESDGCLMSSRHHSPENEPRSRRNEGETEEKSPDYVPSAQCQIQVPNAGILIFFEYLIHFWSY